EPDHLPFGAGRIGRRRGGETAGGQERGVFRGVLLGLVRGDADEKGSIGRGARGLLQGTLAFVIWFGGRRGFAFGDLLFVVEKRRRLNERRRGLGRRGRRRTGGRGEPARRVAGTQDRDQRADHHRRAPNLRCRGFE